MSWLLLIAATIAPALLASFFFSLGHTRFVKFSHMKKQIIIGVAFGILACLDTQFGIPYSDCVLNVRSAAPLTAGLIFGGPAGIIAGVIGGIYRWVSVYWGVAAYTKVACSIATVLAGLFAALSRKFMFDQKKTSWFYGAMIAAATEVIHMLLVFVTHMDDISKAFKVVQTVAVIMIVANAVAVMLSLLVVAYIARDVLRKKGNAHSVTQTFAVSLLITLVISFVLANAFTYLLQNNVSDMQVNQLLSKNVSDVESDITESIDRDLLERTENVKEAIQYHTYLTEGTNRSGLEWLLPTVAKQQKVSEINIVGRDGVIVLSTDKDNEGYDMDEDPTSQAAEFMCLFEGAETYVQAFCHIARDSSIMRKYAGVALNDNYYIQVGYDKTMFQSSLQSTVQNMAAHRHIGQTGFLCILEPSEEHPIISAPVDTVTEEEALGFIADMDNIPDETVVLYTNVSGENFYVMKDTVEGYLVLGCIPEAEAIESRNISVYIGALMQLTIFFVIFILVFMMLKRIIIDDINKINASLAKITGGDLDSKVDVHDNEEFVSLSDGINTTVERLKGYIHEAEKRMEKDLALAKDIQHSALPSVFPPYPNRTEFDLYATMDTAKEVGGDFYDFYLLDRAHLVFLIADVSGKGVPAAMFMMTAKTMIKSYAESGMSVADVFTTANEKLCESNEAGMFVTAWMGIIDLSTGLVKFANAGHNPPVVRHGNGSFEYLKSRAGFVLAGMDGVHYRENEIQLNAGDEIFLYTDGVTESTNIHDELLGEDRLLACLNAHADLSAQEICKAVKVTIDEFVGEAPQFDDITMLSLKLDHLM